MQYMQSLHEKNINIIMIFLSLYNKEENIVLQKIPA